MLRAAVFLIVTALSCGAALVLEPAWGLIAYAVVYFNPPQHSYWGAFLPGARWSLMVSAVVAAAAALHRDKVPPGRMQPVYLTLAFLLLTALVTLGLAVDPVRAWSSTYSILTYLIIVFLLVKSIGGLEELRRFDLTVVALAALLSFQAVFEGNRQHGRLENFGPSDAMSSNEFGMLLAAVIPLILPFVLKGRWYERAVGIRW